VARTDFLRNPGGLTTLRWIIPPSSPLVPMEKTLASIVNDRVGLWDVESGKHTATLERGFRSVTLTTDGKLVVLLENDARSLLAFQDGQVHDIVNAVEAFRIVVAPAIVNHAVPAISPAFRCSWAASAS